MANYIYDEQRSADGSAVFDDQQQSPTVQIGAALVSTASITSTLQLYTVTLTANLTVVSTVVSSAVLMKFRLATNLSCAQSVSANLRLIKHKLSASLVSVSNNTVSLRVIESRFSATFLSGSALTAQLSSIPVQDRVFAANIISGSVLWAKLYTTLDTQIPAGASLKMVPADSDHKNLERFRGDTYSDTFIVFNDRTGDFVDLTGCVLKLTLSNKRVPQTYEHIVYTLNGTLDSSNRGFVQFTPDSIQADRVGFYWYEIEMREPQGTVRTLLNAKYVYKQDIVP